MGDVHFLDERPGISSDALTAEQFDLYWLVHSGEVENIFTMH